jgi:hypothetical protein
MHRARVSTEEFEVEVFERNLLGRAFYAGLEFELVHKKVHDQTGFEIMRLRLAADTALQPPDDAGD